MADKLKPGTKSWDRRQAIWSHNALIGAASMIKASCNRVITSKTASPVSMRLAWEIKDLALRLETSLRNNRIDP